MFLMLQVLPDEKGNYTLYKSVNPDLSSFYSESWKYKGGKNWEDKTLKRNQAVECGEGCRFTTYSGAVAFAENKPHVILQVKINLKDILSIHKKVRVKKYTNLKIVKLNF